MKKLQIKACYEIAVNSKNICIVGKTLNIYKKIDFEYVCSFSDMQGYSCAIFYDNYILVTKNTAGIFKIYDILKNECIRTITLIKIQRYAQDSDFIISPDKLYIFDVITVKLSTDVRFYKININTGESEYVKLGEDIRVIKKISYNNITGRVLVMHDRAADMVDGELKGLCTITQVDYHKMICEDIYTRLTPITNGPILFYDNNYILFENMEIIDIYSGEVVGKVNYSYRRMQYGYFVKAYFSKDKKYLFFIYTDKIIVYDFIKEKVFREYKDEYCAHAEIVGDQILIGTWKKVYILDL